MSSPLICGSFQNHEEDGDFEFLATCTCASPKSKKPTKRHSFGGSSCKGKKNPYADRGLDKFSALVAELDSKRRKIYTEKGSQDISLLGFAYSKPDDYKPIVVRLKNKKEQTISSQKDKHTSDYNISSPELSEIEAAKPDQVKVLSRIVSNIKISPKKVRFDMLQNIRVDNLRQPAYYLPLITILILAFLTVFGRSFTILCTTLCWYFIPTIQSLDVKKTKTVKKDYVKALSYNKIITSNDYEISDMKKAKTMKKAKSFNNKFVKISSNLDHGLSSPKSVFGCKSPPQSVSQP